MTIKPMELTAEMEAVDGGSESDRPEKQKHRWLGHIGSSGILALKLVKSVKAIKAVLAASTLGSFAWMWTWEFAIIMVVGLMVHEYGHCWAMRRVGIPTKGFYLIPFMGGAAVPDRGFQSRGEEAFVAIMGPVWGFLPVIVMALGYAATGMAVLGGGAALVAAINLFNFLPIMPLDGGRMLRSITFSVNSKLGVIAFVLGIVVAVIMTYQLGSVMFGAVTVAAAIEFALEWRSGKGITRMNRWQILGAVGATIVTVCSFVAVIAALNGAPGVEVAVAALTGGGE